MAPTWDTAVDRKKLAAERKRLFPLGSPARLAASEQITLDAMDHLLTSVQQEGAPRYPPEFLVDAKERLSQLRDALDLVIRRTVEVSMACLATSTARQAWDTHYTALEEVASGLLRLAGTPHLLRSLFHGNDPPLPSQRSSSTPRAIRSRHRT